MKFDPEKLDLFKLAGLRPKPQSEEEKRYASFHKRNVAAVIDSLIVTLTVAPLAEFLFIQTHGPIPISDLQLSGTNSAEVLSSMFQAFWNSEYFMARMKWHLYALLLFITVCWHFWSSTPGKLLLRMRIVDVKTGRPMGNWQSIIRLFAYFVSALPFGLGFFVMGMNKKKRALHDYVAGTVVVNEPWYGIRQMFKPVAAADHPINCPAPSQAE